MNAALFLYKWLTKQDARAVRPYSVKKAFMMQ